MPMDLKFLRELRLDSTIKARTSRRDTSATHEANKTSSTDKELFMVGDRGWQTKDEYFFVTGRINEFLNRNGEKIHWVELDSVVVQNPSIAGAVCIAISDEMYGHNIGVAVVLRVGEHAPS